GPRVDDVDITIAHAIDVPGALVASDVAPNTPALVRCERDVAHSISAKPHELAVVHAVGGQERKRLVARLLDLLLRLEARILGVQDPGRREIGVAAVAATRGLHRACYSRRGANVGAWGLAFRCRSVRRHPEIDGRAIRRPPWCAIRRDAKSARKPARIAGR